MNELVILDVFWDRQLVQDKSGRQYEIFRGKDYDTDWENLGHGYSKDDNRIYYYDTSCFGKFLKQIHLETFVLLEANESMNTVYFKDKNSVYLDSFMCGFSILEEADPNSFKILDIEEGYSTSGEFDYYYDSRLPYSLSELTPINAIYQKVGEHIYFGHLSKMVCDTSSFKLVHPKVSTIAKDKNSLFFKDKIVPEANPDTFHFLTECIGPNSPRYLDCDIHFYAVDDKHAYFVNVPFGIKVIKTKDLKNFTFEVIGKIGYGRDSIYRYEKGIRRKIE